MLLIYFVLRVVGLANYRLSTPLFFICAVDVLCNVRLIQQLPQPGHIPICCCSQQGKDSLQVMVLMLRRTAALCKLKLFGRNATLLAALHLQQARMLLSFTGVGTGQLHNCMPVSQPQVSLPGPWDPVSPGRNSMSPQDCAC